VTRSHSLVYHAAFAPLRFATGNIHCTSRCIVHYLLQDQRCQPMRRWRPWTWVRSGSFAELSRSPNLRAFRSSFAITVAMGWQPWQYHNSRPNTQSDSLSRLSRPPRVAAPGSASLPRLPAIAYMARLPALARVLGRPRRNIGRHIKCSSSGCLPQDACLIGSGAASIHGPRPAPQWCGGLMQEGR